MNNDAKPGKGNVNRRNFLRKAGALGLAGLASSQVARAVASDASAPRLFTAPDQPNPLTITMPFENGDRPLIQYPEKRPLIRLGDVLRRRRYHLARNSARAELRGLLVP